VSSVNTDWAAASSRITLSRVRTTNCRTDSGSTAWPTTSSRRCTITVSPLVVASASIRCSSPLGRMSKPLTAPACSIAVRISVWMSFSTTISPETACDTLSTVARSRDSIGAPIVLANPIAGASSLRCG
jgi:hypothetical protein